MSKLKYILLLILLGGITYIPFNGHVHLFDIDEINFSESAREMLITKNYSTVQINFQPFWEKPPLYIWMQAASMSFFGVNEFAARFPNAVCGIITLILLFLFGAKVYNESFGLIWSLVYLVSILPFVYFKSGIIDPWFNLFIFISIWFLFNWWERKERENGNWQIALSAFFIGLAILTKGPVALLILVLIAISYFVYNRFRMPLKWQHVFIYILIVLFTGGFWFILQLIKGNYQVIIDFLNYQIRLLTTKESGHGGFILYHFIVLIFGVFPASIYALRAFTKNKFDGSLQKRFKRWMMILLWVVLILFTLVQTKIIHYSSLCYFSLSFMAAWTLYYYINGRIRLRWYYHLSIGFIAFIYIALAFILPSLDHFKSFIIHSGITKDEFLMGALQANGGWTNIELIPGIILIIGVFIYFLIIKIHHRPLALISLGISIWLFAYTSVYFFSEKVERYSQRALIEFCQSKAGADCYVYDYDFKSYAPYYYTNKMRTLENETLGSDWFLRGDIDKPVYIICKNYSKKKLFDKGSDIYLLYEKNGYVFCSRRPKPKINDHD